MVPRFIPTTAHGDHGASCGDCLTFRRAIALPSYLVAKHTLSKRPNSTHFGAGLMADRVLDLLLSQSAVPIYGLLIIMALMVWAGYILGRAIADG